MLRFSGAGVSDVGLVRPHNEDSTFVGPYAALVADGVGGAAAGEVASATAAYVASAVALSRFGRDLSATLREAVSLARTVLRVGVLEEVPHHPWRNVVMRCLDANPATDLDDLDLLDLDARVGDRVLLCSDGLTDFVAEERIAEVLRLADPHSAAAVLTQAALTEGGRDNITCVVVDVVEGPVVVGDGQLLGAVWDFTNVVDPAAVHL